MGELGSRPVGKPAHRMNKVDAVSVIRKGHGNLSFSPRKEGFLKSIAPETLDCMVGTEAIWRKIAAEAEPCSVLFAPFPFYEEILSFIIFAYQIVNFIYISIIYCIS